MRGDIVVVVANNNISSFVHYLLKIHIMSTKALNIKDTSTKRIFTFQAVSRNEESNPHTISMWDWIRENENIKIESQSSASGNKSKLQKIKFSLAGKAAAYYPLLKGVIASGPSSNWIPADTKDRSFTFIFDVESEIESFKYLVEILRIVEEEVRFKQVLRKVIINQEKFELEEKLLFHELSK
jgi:hypothetical protein